MTAKELRDKYPTFQFDRFASKIFGNQILISYYYSAPPDYSFVHKLVFDFPSGMKKVSDELIFQIGLSLIPSYWKLTCSPVIDIKAGNLTLEQMAFWHKLFIRGMGEYFYKNQIDFTPNDFLNIKYKNSSPAPTVNSPSSANNTVLIPVGGGKDSIVTLELLKSNFEVTPFVINPVPIMLNVIKIANVSPTITVTSEIDQQLLELNKQGYLNGHVPISSFYAFSAALAAAASGQKFIAFSNERSSNEGNTSWLGHEINHQYSKTLEFESDLHKYLMDLKLNLNCFSFLRPLSEISITELFSRFPQYFPVFTSCNRNFKISSDHQSPAPNQLWCYHCPKCVSTALMLACFIGKEKVAGIMGKYPPDLPENQNVLSDLLGKNPVKPFECVLTRAEARAALEFTTANRSSELDKILSSWENNPNLPTVFASILEKSL